MSGGMWARRPGVLWRLVPNGVVVRRAHQRDVDAEAQLTGSAALVWAELDAARTENELLEALADAGAQDPGGMLRSALDLLERSELVALVEP